MTSVEHPEPVVPADVAARSQALRLRFMVRPVFRADRAAVRRIAGEDELSDDRSSASPVSGSDTSRGRGAEEHGNLPLTPGARDWYLGWLKAIEALPRENLRPGGPDAIARRIGMCLTEDLVHARFASPPGVNLARLDQCIGRLRRHVDAARALEGGHRPRLGSRAAGWLDEIVQRRESIAKALARRADASPRDDLNRVEDQHVRLYRSLCHERSAFAFSPATLDALCVALGSLAAKSRVVAPDRTGAIERRQRLWESHAARAREVRAATTLPQMRRALALEVGAIEHTVQQRFRGPKALDRDAAPESRPLALRLLVFRLADLEDDLSSLASAFTGCGALPLLRRVYRLESRLSAAWTRELIHGGSADGEAPR